MTDLDSRLWAREEQFWLGGVDVYREHLVDDSLMVFPGMVLTKPQTLESMANEFRWTAVSFTARRLARLTQDAVALVYHASGSRHGEEEPYSALVVSVYVWRDGDWKLALHQQSPGGRPR